MNIPNKTLESFGGDEFRAKIFLDRYAGPGELTWNDTIFRIMYGLDSVPERKFFLTHQEFEALFDDILHFNFIPGGRILSTVGLSNPLTLYNCLTLPRPHDSIEGIMKTATELALALKKGAGVGLRLDSLRAKGTKVESSNGTSSGSVAFGSLFNSIVGTINQGGSRRGALLLAQSIGHDDFFDFVEAKSKLTEWNNVNTTVMLNRGDILKYPERWSKIIEHAHATGEPGILFMDRAQEIYRGHLRDLPLEGVNACSEVLLPSYGCCLLGSLNLAKDLEPSIVKRAIKFLYLCHLYALRNNRFPLEACKPVTQKSMQIGLGVMGLAHHLFNKRIKYGSTESLKECNLIWKDIEEGAEEANSELVSDLTKFNLNLNPPMSMLSCPPTGTTSLLAGTSSGIEPVFNLVSKRTDRLGEHFICDPYYKMIDCSKSKPDWLVDSTMIDPLDRVRIQAIIQSRIDNAISSTVNLPNEATQDDVRKVFELAAELGCVSATVYRQGSREGVYTSVKPTAKKPEEQVVVQSISEAPSKSVPDSTRPFKLPGITYKFPFGERNIYICVNSKDKGEPFEVFVNSPGMSEAWAKAATIFISRLLRKGERVEDIVSKLSKIASTDSSCWVNGDCIPSEPAAIAYALKDFTRLGLTEVSGVTLHTKPASVDGTEPCPSCGSYDTLIRTGKCKSCTSCGYETCS